eukprot:1146237-Pelagomonas_calceolata.AAC.6
MGVVQEGEQEQSVWAVIRGGCGGVEGGEGSQSGMDSAKWENKEAVGFEPTTCRFQRVSWCRRVSAGGCSATELYLRISVLHPS